jgi:hypothetical protein
VDRSSRPDLQDALVPKRRLHPDSSASRCILLSCSQAVVANLPDAVSAQVLDFVDVESGIFQNRGRSSMSEMGSVSV